jgi:hypothetical protein
LFIEGLDEIENSDEISVRKDYFPETDNKQIITSCVKDMLSGYAGADNSLTQLLSVCDEHGNQQFFLTGDWMPRPHTLQYMIL